MSADAPEAPSLPEAVITHGNPGGPFALNELSAPPESAPPSEGSPSEAPASTPAAPAPDEEARKALRGVQKRIGELTAQTQAAREEGRQAAEYWRQQAVAANEQLAKAKQQQAPPAFESYNGNMNEWAREVAAFEAKRVADEREANYNANWARQQQDIAEANAQRQAAAHYQQMVESKVTEAIKKHPDFVEVISNPELPGIRATPAFSAILDSEHGADIMYFLGKNPLRAHQIVALSPLGQVREIGRIEASLATGTAVSSAPPPVETLGGAKGTAPKDPATMTYDEFVKYRRRQIAAKRR